MRLTPGQYANALYKSLSSSSEDDQDKIVTRFAEILNANNALGLIDEIEEEFRRFDSEAKGIRTAEVTSAKALTEKEEKALIRELNNYVAGRVEIKKKVDEGLIGGVVVRLDDELIDGSVKRRLKELNDKLNS